MPINKILYHYYILLGKKGVIRAFINLSLIKNIKIFGVLRSDKFFLKIFIILKKNFLKLLGFLK